MGLLYDNHIELDGPRAGLNPRLLGLYNRGYYGTSHGWAIAHSVAWNCDLANGDLIVQKPPTAQNYAIGCFGANITGQYPPASFNELEGYIEGSNLAGLEPRSLYLAQLNERRPDVVNLIEKRNPIVKQVRLLPNYPNPFNASTIIPFSLEKPADVKLKIYNIHGQEIFTLINNHLSAGVYYEQWNGRDFAGKTVPTGLYIYILNTNDLKQTGKMLLMK